MEGFEWDSLKKGDVVVDVGGGIGLLTCILAKKYPELKYIVQDLPVVIADGVKVS
jgi:16S rRNA A1518/A1519 N6-dimethyltransferase RsmA/KsgA/DIM1 with predicted DNA glycosylase/AP lyase activity